MDKLKYLCSTQDLFYNEYNDYDVSIQANELDETIW